MENKKRISDAVEILHRRYIKDDPERKAALESVRVNAQVALTIYELRTQAGLSQKQLAELIGTTQSVISRLEDEEYEGHSLNVLNRIANALNQRLTVVVKAADPKVGTLRYAFQMVLRDLRRERGLTIDQLAERCGIDREELIASERDPGYRPSPLTLHQISRFYKISERRLAVLAGAFAETPNDLVDSASRFAAQSESFAGLTRDEKKALDEFVSLLKSD